MDLTLLMAFGTLFVLELVLGIDNIIFISILTGKLPARQQQTARLAGLSLAVGMRILLLLLIAWIVRLTAPLFSVFGHAVSGRDVILIGGGLFLLAKSTFEIHEKLEGHAGGRRTAKAPSFSSVIVQIVLLDIIFSLDSVITAIGMVDRIGVMVAAILSAAVCMVLLAKAISDFVHRHPTVKILALSFLLLIGVSLIAEGSGHHIPKGYIYFAMAFSVFVEMLNLQFRKTSAPVELHEPHLT